MGFFGFGDKRQEQQTSPAPQQQPQHQQQTHQELTFPQKVYRIWHSNQNYVTELGYEYDWQHKKQLDESLYTHLGCSNMDDLMEIKAPRFHYSFYTICKIIEKMYKYIKNNIKSNNDYQKNLGENEALKKQCEQQEALIREFMGRHSENKQHSHSQKDNGFVR